MPRKDVHGQCRTDPCGLVEQARACDLVRQHMCDGIFLCPVYKPEYRGARERPVMESMS